MTEKELSKYYWLNKEIKDLEQRIEEFGDGLGATKYDATIKAVGASNTSIQERRAMLREKYIEKRISAIEEYLKIENYISGVDDPEIRLIMRKRFLDLQTWEEIADSLFLERTTPAKKLRKYIKLSHFSH